MSEQVIPSADIDAILAQRMAAMEQVAIIAQANSELAYMAGKHGMPSFMLSFETNHRERWSEKLAQQRIDREIWSHLLKKSGMWDFMDAKARAEWRKAYDNQEFPELTPENIRTAFEDMHSQRGKMLSRGVLHLFERLSSHHKTNSPMAFRRKMIVEYMCQNWGGHLSVSHQRADLVDDLNRTLHILHGEPQPVERSWQVMDRAVPGEADFPYFTVRLFKKGTAHMRFKNEEDVQKLNAMLDMASGFHSIAKER